jgi:putative membrane protein
MLSQGSSWGLRMTFPSPEIQAFATGFPVTLLHVAVTLLLLFAGAGVYIMLTPQKEVTLVREGNLAAAVSLGGILLGLAIPLAAAMKASTNLVDLTLWGVATLVVQLLISRLTDLALHGLSKRIQDGEVAAATLLAAVKIATGLVLGAAVAG